MVNITFDVYDDNKNKIGQYQYNTETKEFIEAGEIPQHMKQWMNVTATTFANRMNVQTPEELLIVRQKEQAELLKGIIEKYG